MSAGEVGERVITIRLHPAAGLGGMSISVTGPDHESDGERSQRSVCIPQTGVVMDAVERYVRMLVEEALLAEKKAWAGRAGTTPSTEGETA